MFSITEDLKKDGVKRVILDTDTYNEIDDQFALATAMLAPDRIDLVCVTAAPFHNENSTSFGDGMERSYREIGVCTDLVSRSHGVKIPPYYRGATERMPDMNTPVPSEAADAIRRHVMEYDGITYVVGIGAITNIASAILLYPEICDKIAVIWLGGHARWFHGGEFNLKGDVNAANAVFASSVPLLVFPCLGVVSHITLSVVDLEHFLRGNSPLGDYLCDNVQACVPEGITSFSRVIWDVSTICGILSPVTFAAMEVPRPYVNENYEYEWDKNEGTMEHVEFIHRDLVISEMINRLRK